MSKKERLRLRKEYHEIQNLEATELANKVIETSVINPTDSSELSSDSKRIKMCLIRL